MTDFNELWREITKRPGVITVQNKEEQANKRRWQLLLI